MQRQGTSPAPNGHAIRPKQSGRLSLQVFEVAHDEATLAAGQLGRAMVAEPAPGDLVKIYRQPRTARHEHDFLRALAETCEFLGHVKAAKPEDADLSLVWGWDRLVPDQPTVHVESGWLPRWRYQVSWCGINRYSHVAKMWPVRGTAETRELAQRYLARLRHETSDRYPSSFVYADPTRGALPRIQGSFILAPLQVENDRNLADARESSMQRFIERLAAWDPPMPIVFKRHPARLADGALASVLREQDWLVDALGTTVHAYLRHPGCAATVTLNSNTAHDALIWDVPVIALEAGSWPEDGPFWTGSLPRSWPGFQRFAAGKGMQDARLDYVSLLMQEQWDFARADSEDEVAALVAKAMHLTS